MVQECQKVLEEEFPEFKDRIEHVGGATEEGEGIETVSEKYIPRENADPGDHRGASHADISWRDKADPKTPDDPRRQAHASTMTMQKDGETPVAQERRSLENLVNNVGEELAIGVPKLRPGMDEEEYRETVREKCREIFGKFIDKIKREEAD